MTGNFLAILGSAVYAVYTAQGSQVVRQNRCPLSLYLTLMSVCMIGFSYIMAPVMRMPPPTFSMDPQTGVFGLFQTS